MIDANDPKLTAYVLGELSDNERAEVEAAIAQNEQLRRVVNAIRETTGILAAELGTATSAALSNEQRTAIVEQYEQHSGVLADAGSLTLLSTRAAGFSPRGASEKNAKRNPWRIWLPLSAAASLILVAGWYYAVLPSLSRTHELPMSVVTRTEREQRPKKLLIQNNEIHNQTVAARKMLWERKPAHVHRRIGRRQGSHLAPSGEGGTSQGYVATSNQLSKNDDSTVFYAANMAVNDSNVSSVTNQPSSPTTSKRFLPDSTEKSRTYDAHDKIDTQLFVASGGDHVQTIGSSDALQTGSGSSVVAASRGKSVARRRARRISENSTKTHYAAKRAYLQMLASSADPNGRFHKSSNVPGSLSRPENPNSCESYENLPENPFLMVGQHPLSTFSIDVDTASYANVRRMLNQNVLPPPGAVRIEELVNYFSYDYPLPEGDDPFSVNVEIAECPWYGSHRLARIGIKGMEYTEEQRPASNLVFLLDVSGSMSSLNKLPLLKKSLGLLIERLSEYDSVAIVVYAGASGLTLPATMCDDKATILTSLDNLNAGGSTNGGAGIQLAYDIASENFIEGGNNRVILATDGDFNVGTTSRTALLSLIEQKAQTGVFLSVLGFGMGNLKDSTLEMLADKGNGNYAYIDTLGEAQKVLVDDMTGTLITIAKDVKIQVEFNPAQVSAYRLVGYENRMLAAKDFNDDTKDAGEIGAGHTVTALYEIVPVGVQLAASTVDPLKYQQVDEADLAEAAFSGEMMTVKLRYKKPDGEISSLIEMPIVDQELKLRDASDDFAFAAAVASFGMNLRQSQHAGEFDFNACYNLAESGLGDDPYGYRAEFLTLVAKAITLSGEDR